MDITGHDHHEDREDHDRDHLYHHEEDDDDNNEGAIDALGHGWPRRV